MIRKLGHNIVTKHRLFSSPFFLKSDAPDTRSAKEQRLHFLVMFQFSGRSIRRDISFTAICTLVSIRIIRMFKCTTMLPYLRRCSQRFFFFFSKHQPKPSYSLSPGHSCSPWQQWGYCNQPNGKRTQTYDNHHW